MSQRLSRKEIKRDEFMESVGEVFDYIQTHAKQLLAIAAGVVAAAVVAVLMMVYSQRRNVQANEALAEALEVVHADIDPAAAQTEDPQHPSFVSPEARRRESEKRLEAVRSEFGRTDAAAIATVYLGQMAAAQGNDEAARRLWEEYLDRSRKGPLAVEVQMNLMALDRAAGRGDELVTRLRAMLSGADEGLPHDLLWFQLGVTLDHLGRAAEAQETYQRLIDEYPQSSYAASARQRVGGDTAPLFGS